MNFALEYGQETSGQASGQVRVKDLRSPMWKMKVESANMDIRRLRAISAMIGSLGGSLESFYAWDPGAQFPANDPDGSILGEAAVQIASLGADNKSLAFKGLPAGYVLTAGDLFAYDFNGRRALHQVTAASTVANGSGVTPVFGVAPHLRQGVVTNTAVMLKRPAAEMRIIPGTINFNLAALTGQAGFEAAQVV
ncbi:MAG TPA: hypothetical protein VGN75_15635 [Kaistia sp.]|nr:hypothetical protein [Kaistia sp.]